MQASMREEYRVEGLNEPISHYTDAVRFGDLLFVSGIAPLDSAGRVVGDDIVSQTRQVFENLKAALAASGASFKDVVKLTSFLVDMSQLEKYRDVRSEYLKGLPDPPTSTTVAVPRLVREDYLLEVEAIAVLP